MKKKILAISGSRREASANKAILEFIAKKYQAIFDIQIYDQLDQFPHFNPDLDMYNLPEIIKDFRSKILAADGVLISTPEYVFSLPGSFKNAIEWTVSSTVFSNKPVALIVGAVIGEKTFESLFLLMSTIEARIDPNARLLIKGVQGKFGKDGEIIDDELVEQIEVLIQAFDKSIEAKDEVPTKYQ